MTSDWRLARSAETPVGLRRRMPAALSRATRNRRAQERVRLAEQRVSTRLRELGLAAHDDLLALLETSEDGLPFGEAERRLEDVGRNEITHEKARPWYVQLLAAYPNPFNLLLTGLAIAGLVMGDPRTVAVLATMIVVGTLMRFIQENRSGRAAARLRSMVSTTAAVRRRDDRREWLREASARDGVLVGAGGPMPPFEIPIDRLVPGDVVLLSAGDMVPADVRLLATKDLFVSQAVLTGESLPVEKYDTLGAVMEKRAEGAASAHDGALLELHNVAFMGTNIVSGSATAVVLATGDDTYFGAMAAGLAGVHPPTAFDRGVRATSLLLVRFTLSMIPIVLLLNGFIKGSWAEALTFALAVGVGLTPEMLPVVVTGALARGALALSRQKVITKRLNAIQNIGAIDVLCTDKTGTLTRDRIILERHLDVEGDESSRVLELAYLNSHFQTGLRILLDRSVL